MTNPFIPRGQSGGWVVPVSLMTLILGFMASTAYVDTDRKTAIANELDRLSGQGINPDLSMDQVRQAERIDKLEKEISKLNARNTELQDALSKQGNSSNELNKALQDIKRIAGLTKATGPGVQITLKDSKRGPELLELEAGIIHDHDILKVVNELWNAGAEAISIDDRRVGPNTNIRCVGTTVLVDQQKIASPITIRAIGSTKNLLGGMNLPGGVLDELRQTDASMVKVEGLSQITVPAWSGSTEWAHATVPQSVDQ